jgi:hypothetical protein
MYPANNANIPFGICVTKCWIRRVLQLACTKSPQNNLDWMTPTPKNQENKVMEHTMQQNGFTWKNRILSRNVLESACLYVARVKQATEGQ